MAQTPPFDEIGYWSEIKLDIIREYASAYSRVLSNQNCIRRHIYIDAFSGPGIHISKNTGEFVDGSPLNALLVDPPFCEFHFIDLDMDKLDALRQIVGNRSNATIHHGDCNEVLLDRVFDRCRYEDFARGLCLLDPYKLNVDWKVLKKAGAMRSVEVFYNFMIMDANRNVLWRNPEKVRSEERNRFTNVWGDETWRDAAYDSTQRLFSFDSDSEEFVSEKKGNEAIAKAFQERLRKVAGFTYVPDPIPLRNSTGAVVYYLYFASFNATGAKIVKHIFNKYRERC
jgi:three-Cys-motif partner protein